jgi:hypothetical protein
VVATDAEAAVAVHLDGDFLADEQAAGGDAGLGDD